MLLGAGHAFVSGTDRALLWTSLAESGRHGEYPRWEGRLRAASQTSEAVSVAAGGWLYTLAPRRARPSSGAVCSSPWATPDWQ
jgi:hypothetical protein